ncbi:MAG: metal-dependent hydrolase [Caldilineae bacterium]|nr:MAG: metal-dependent hydrolase [Caldilineae bacterium]
MDVVLGTVSSRFSDPARSSLQRVMLPQSHIAYTLAAYQWARDRWPGVPDLDLRWLALAAMGPDLIDKPLAALYFYRRFKSAVLFAHTLLFQIGLLFWARERKRLLPYALAFVGHILLDRMWFFPETFYWPFKGWRFTVWRKRGSEQKDIGKAYWYAFTRRRELWGWELGGALAALWLIIRLRLYRPERLLRLLRTGRSGPAYPGQ